MKMLKKFTISLLLLLTFASVIFQNVSAGISQSSSLTDNQDLKSNEIKQTIKETSEIKREPKKVKELREKRTSNSKHYLMDDGSIQTIVFANDINYESSAGTFEEIKTTLIDGIDIEMNTNLLSKEVDDEARIIKSLLNGKVSEAVKDNIDYIAPQVPFDVRLPKFFNKGFSIGKKEDKLTFIPVDAKSVSGAVYDENSIKYNDVWTSTDVQLEVQTNGLKETIIVKDENAPNKFVYELLGNINDNLNNNNLQITPSWLEDKNGQHRDVTTNIYKSNGKQFVSLEADFEGLQFPVIIDPSVLVSSASKNTMMCSDYSSANYQLMVMSNGYNYTRCVSLIQFDISSIPSNSVISSATMSLVQIGTNNSGPDGTVNVYRNIQDWNMSTYWDIQPQIDPSLITSLKMPSRVYADTVRKFDVSTAVSLWISGTSNYGLKLVGDSIDGSISFLSKEWPYGGTPSLTVNYNVPPNSPIILTPNGGEIVDTNYLITWSSAFDQDTTQSQLKYQIQLSLNGGTSWTDILPVSAAGTNSYSYNFSSSSSTNQALIRIRAFDGVSYGPWDQSNAPFTIKHNQAPTAPTNATPGGNTAGSAALVPGTALPLGWQFVDSDTGDTQTVYRVRLFQNSGTLVNDTNWTTSSLQTHSIPSNLFTRGTIYYWNVQTKDKAGAESPLSTSRYIKINQLPQATLTSYTNNQTVPDNQLTFTWSYSDPDSHIQMKYQVQGSKDEWATIAYNSNEIASSSASHTAVFSQGEWDFRVRVYDGYEWSNWAYRNNLTLPNSFEPNDMPSEAFGIQYDQSYSTLISSASDVDFYSYTANKTGIDRIKLTVPNGVNYDLYIYDNNMNLLATGAKTMGEEDILLYVQDGQTYYAKVFGIDGDWSSSPYSLQLTQFGVTNNSYQTTYDYDDNGNLTNKETIVQ